MKVPCFQAPAGNEERYPRKALEARSSSDGQFKLKNKLGENVQLEFIEKLNESQFQDLCELFKNEWWSYYRKPEEIKTLIENSDLLIGIIDKGTGRLVAFARVLTDYIFRSMIYDVIVGKEYRNKGIGKMLLRNIIEHPALQQVEFLELQTQPELIPYYRQFGLKEEIVGKMKTMRIIKKKENMKKYEGGIKT